MLSQFFWSHVFLLQYMKFYTVVYWFVLKFKLQELHKVIATCALHEKSLFFQANIRKSQARIIQFKNYSYLKQLSKYPPLRGVKSGCKDPSFAQSLTIFAN